MNNKTLIIALAVFGAALSILVGITWNEVQDLEAQNEALKAQTIALVQKGEGAKRQGFLDGIEKCSSEDVTYLNEQADYWYAQGSPEGDLLGDYFAELASTWAYEEDTLKEMARDYMGTNTN